MKYFSNLIILASAIFVATLFAQIETLPAPIVNRHSFEILSNSRYSVHSGFSSSLSNQVLANILWAMNRVPRISPYWEVYVATPTNVYQYDPQSHTLNLHLAGNHRYSASSAFEIGIASDRYEDCGFAIQVGLLAACAFWDSANSNVVSCPMQFATNYANNNWNPTHPIKMVNVYGQATRTGLNSTCVAISSDSTLPLPSTGGPDTFEVLLTNLEQDSIFSPIPLSQQTISQLLWAGYGVTPHMTSNNRRGLTVPSAIANYYLTGKIYLVNDSGVFRYHNRLPPGTNLTTADHRLELVTNEDRRTQLRAASSRIPSTAPVYIVITVSDTSSNYNMLEAGFTGIQYLMQAKALGLSGFLTVPLSPTERSAIINALGIPANNYPVIIFSVGELATEIKESKIGLARTNRIQAKSPQRIPVKIEYWLEKAGTSQIIIYDLAGRPVYAFAPKSQKAGNYKIEWNGNNQTGQPMPPGVYFARLIIGKEIYSTRIILTR
ncbi:MAG: FlgD immunoglobulin-like domain containing protein [candidate division WOR-3 bacterium]